MNVKSISRTVGLILLITGIFQLFPLLILSPHFAGIFSFCPGKIRLGFEPITFLFSAIA